MFVNNFKATATHPLFCKKTVQSHVMGPVIYTVIQKESKVTHSFRPGLIPIPISVLTKTMYAGGRLLAISRRTVALIRDAGLILLLIDYIPTSMGSGDQRMYSNMTDHQYCDSNRVTR